MIPRHSYETYALSLPRSAWKPVGFRGRRPHPERVPENQLFCGPRETGTEGRALHRLPVKAWQDTFAIVSTTEIDTAE
jgi:hypothetical protein